jgi:hypothetical protein
MKSQPCSGVRVLQSRQGQLVCAPDEIAFHNGWISAEDLKALALKLDKTQYSRRLSTICGRIPVIGSGRYGQPKLSNAGSPSCTAPF